MKERLLRVLTAVLFLCYGCPSEESGSLSAVAASAGNAVVSTARLNALVANPRDPEALISMTRIYTDLSAVANAKGDGAGLFTTLTARKASLEVCVTEQGSVIAYDDCTVSNGIIDGTVTSSGDGIDFDLAIIAQGTGGEGRLSVLMDGGITLTERSLTGLLTYDTIIEGVDEYPDGLSLMIQADYVDITLDEVQCPLSGSLLVEQEVLGVSTGIVETVFGPNCGDVRVLE